MPPERTCARTPRYVSSAGAAGTGEHVPPRLGGLRNDQEVVHDRSWSGSNARLLGAARIFISRLDAFSKAKNEGGILERKRERDQAP